MMTTAAPSPVPLPSPDRDWSALRRDFPVLAQQVNGHPLIYLDNAATSQKPGAVIEVLKNYYERDNSNVHRGVHELSNRATLAFEAARRTTAAFLHASHPDEIVFTRGTTESLNLVAQSWGRANIKAGEVILLTEMEHHSNLVPWQMLAEQTGAILRFVPIIGDGECLALDQLPALLEGPVRLFTFTHLSNTLGVLNPAAELCAMARERGIITVVDAAQSAGHLPVDVRELDCDFLAFSAHKVCGPTGQGVLYGRLPLLEMMPPYQGGGEMIATVDYERSTWNRPPHKFEAGTPHIAGAIGMAAGLDYVDAIGRQAIFAHDQALAMRMAEGLREAIPGIRLLGPEAGRGGLVSFDIPGLHSHDLVTMADRRGVALRGGHHCTMPLHKKLGIPSTARASFYFYNSPEEVDRAVGIIGDLHRKFGG